MNEIEHPEPSQKPIAEQSGGRLADELNAITAAQSAEAHEAAESWRPHAGESKAAYLLRATVPEYTPGTISYDRATPTRRIANAAEVAGLAVTQPEPSPDDALRASRAEIDKLAALDLADTNSSVSSVAVDGALFSETERGRHFIAASSKKDERYYTQLFAGSGDEEVQQAVRERLTGKRIVNLGGGQANLAEELTDFGAPPQSVLNVEPFPSEQADGQSIDPIIQANAADPQLLEHSQLQPGSADEVLALYSVPYYLTNGIEIQTMLANGANLLAPGGNFRIWPITLNSLDATEESLRERQSALIGGLNDLADQGYNVSLIHTGKRGLTAIIHRPDSQDSPRSM